MLMPWCAVVIGIMDKDNLYFTSSSIAYIVLTSSDYQCLIIMCTYTNFNITNVKWPQF